MARQFYSHSIERREIHGDPVYFVYGFGTYERGSVLAGQTRKTFLDSFDTEAEAIKAYPKASRGYRDAGNTFNHLPDENGHRDIGGSLGEDEELY